jgi:hypothetical protein
VPRAQPSCLGVELALYDGRPNFSVSCSTKSKAASGRSKIHPFSGRLGARLNRVSSIVAAFRTGMLTVNVAYCGNG